MPRCAAPNGVKLSPANGYHSTMRHAIAAAVALITISSSTLVAGPGPVANQWKATLEQTATLLQDSEFVEARGRLLKLTREMADEITEPGDADRLLGVALAQLAVAEAGAGNVDDAIWCWQIAQNVHPDIRAFDLSPYGKFSGVLSANILPATPEKCARPANAPAPAVMQRSEPRYPKRARQIPIMGLVIVEIERDSSGRPIHPQVLRSPSAALTYSTLTTLREWRFAPPLDETELPSRFCRIFSFGQHR